MNTEKCKKVGKVLKTHGKEGELLISSDIQLPDNFLEKESIFIEIEGLLVPFFIESLRVKSASTLIVKLEDIDKVEEAEELTSQNWFLSQEQWNALTEQEIPDYNFLVGFTVVDQNDTEIGTVEELIDIPSNTLLQVSYKGKSIEIPLNEETLTLLDEENQRVKIMIPEGLLDL